MHTQTRIRTKHKHTEKGTNRLTDTYKYIINTTYYDLTAAICITVND